MWVHVVRVVVSVICVCVWCVRDVCVCVCVSVIHVCLWYMCAWCVCYMCRLSQFPSTPDHAPSHAEVRDKMSVYSVCRGVAVDDQGYIFVADSGNNRIQIFHPDGTFLRAFGCWGSGDGEFKGLEGIAVMSNGNILVCDRENHRIQVF